MMQKYDALLLKISKSICHFFFGDFCCMMDLMMIESARKDNVQSRFYGGWVCDHYIGSVLVFGPNGTIPICWHNDSGTVHDSNNVWIRNINI